MERIINQAVTSTHNLPNYAHPRWMDRPITEQPANCRRTPAPVTESSKLDFTDLAKLLLLGKLSTTIREVIFRERLIALPKKDGGIHPIAIGYTLRRLATNSANRYVIERRSNDLSPIQDGVGISGGAETAVHSIRRAVDNLSDNNVLVKLDFVNAFN